MRERPLSRFFELPAERWPLAADALHELRISHPRIRAGGTSSSHLVQCKPLRVLVFVSLAHRMTVAGGKPNCSPTRTEFRVFS